jgi:hypothetical protein
MHVRITRKKRKPKLQRRKPSVVHNESHISRPCSLEWDTFSVSDSTCNILNEKRPRFHRVTYKNMLSKLMLVKDVIGKGSSGERLRGPSSKEGKARE